MTVQKVSGVVSAAPEVFDFGRSSAISSDRLRACEDAFAAFARQWATQLTTSVHAVARVRLGGVLVQPTAEYYSAMPEHTAVVACHIEAGRSDAVVQFPTTAALRWFALALGGTLDLHRDERAFTSVELGFVQRVLDDLLLDLGYALRTLLPIAPVWSGVSYAPHTAHPADPSERLLIASFSVSVAGHDDTVTVALPLDVVGEPTRSPGVSGSDGLVADHVARTPVEVALRFDAVSVTPDAVLTLAVGDLLPLGHSPLDPLAITVDDRAVASAAVATSGRQLSFIVTDNATLPIEEIE